ncbi:unnamed protein product [Symbiodinium sp. CCMP2592]|nr:unnamed protein product [Symbiodinium sp. CCMP2592]
MHKTGSSALQFALLDFGRREVAPRVGSRLLRRFVLVVIRVTGHLQRGGWRVGWVWEYELVRVMQLFTEHNVLLPVGRTFIHFRTGLVFFFAGTRTDWPWTISSAFASDNVDTARRDDRSSDRPERCPGKRCHEYNQNAGLPNSTMRDYLQDKGTPFIARFNEVSLFRGCESQGFPFLEAPVRLTVILMALPEQRVKYQQVHYQNRPSMDWYEQLGDYDSLVTRFSLAAKAIRDNAQVYGWEAPDGSGKKPIVIMGVPGCASNVQQPHDAVANCLKHWKQNYSHLFEALHICCRNRRGPDEDLCTRVRAAVNLRERPPPGLDVTLRDQGPAVQKKRIVADRAILDDPLDEDETDEAVARFRQQREITVEMGQNRRGSIVWTSDKIAGFWRKRKEDMAERQLVENAEGAVSSARSQALAMASVNLWVRKKSADMLGFIPKEESGGVGDGDSSLSGGDSRDALGRSGSSSPKASPSFSRGRRASTSNAPQTTTDIQAGAQRRASSACADWTKVYISQNNVILTVGRSSVTGTLGQWLRWDHRPSAGEDFQVFTSAPVEVVGYEPKGSRELCIVMDLQGRRRRGTDGSAAVGEFLALPDGESAAVRPNQQVDSGAAGGEESAGIVGTGEGVGAAVNPFWSERMQNEAQLRAMRPQGLAEAEQTTSAADSYGYGIGFYGSGTVGRFVPPSERGSLDFQAGVEEGIRRATEAMRVGFRCNISRTQHQLDFNPTVTSIMAYARLLQAEMETLALSGVDPDTEETPKLTKKQRAAALRKEQSGTPGEKAAGKGGTSDAGQAGGDNAQASSTAPGKGGQGGGKPNSDGNNGGKGEEATPRGESGSAGSGSGTANAGGKGNAGNPKGDQKGAQVRQVTAGDVSGSSAGTAGEGPQVAKATETSSQELIAEITEELIVEIEEKRALVLHRALRLKAMSCGAVDSSQDSHAPVEDMLQWLRKLSPDGPEGILARVPPAWKGNLCGDDVPFNRRVRRAVSRADRVIIHLFSGKTKARDFGNVPSSVYILSIDLEHGADILVDGTFWNANAISESRGEASEEGVLFVLENPMDPQEYLQDEKEHVSLWDWPEVRYLEGEKGMFRASFSQKLFGHPVNKPTTLLINDWGLYLELHGKHCSSGAVPVEQHPDLQDRLQLSRTWAKWAPGLTQAIGRAIAKWIALSLKGKISLEGITLFPLSGKMMTWQEDETSGLDSAWEDRAKQWNDRWKAIISELTEPVEVGYRFDGQHSVGSAQQWQWGEQKLRWALGKLGAETPKRDLVPAGTAVAPSIRVPNATVIRIQDDDDVRLYVISLTTFPHHLVGYLEKFQVFLFLGVAARHGGSQRQRMLLMQGMVLMIQRPRMLMMLLVMVFMMVMVVRKEADWMMLKGPEKLRKLPKMTDAPATWAALRVTLDMQVDCGLLRTKFRVSMTILRMLWSGMANVDADGGRVVIVAYTPRRLCKGPEYFDISTDSEDDPVPGEWTDTGEPKHLEERVGRMVQLEREERKALVEELDRGLTCVTPGLLAEFGEDLTLMKLLQEHDACEREVELGCSSLALHRLKSVERELEELWCEAEKTGLPQVRAVRVDSEPLGPTTSAVPEDDGQFRDLRDGSVPGELSQAVHPNFGLDTPELVGKGAQPTPGALLQTRIVPQAEVWQNIEDWRQPLTDEVVALKNAHRAVWAIGPEELKRLEQLAVVSVIPAKGVYTQKPITNRLRARIVGCGNFLENDAPVEDAAKGMCRSQELYAGGVDGVSVRLQTGVAAINGWGNASLDIKTAFLGAPLYQNNQGQALLTPSDLESGNLDFELLVKKLRAVQGDKVKIVVVSPPKILVRLGLIEESEKWLVVKALYGLAEAPRRWSAHRDLLLRQLCWEDGGRRFSLVQCEADANLWRVVSVQQPESTQDVDASSHKPVPGTSTPNPQQEDEGPKLHGLLGVYVDDMLITADGATTDNLIRELRAIWSTSEPEVAEVGRPIRFCGFNLHRLTGGGYLLNQEDYVQDLLQRFSDVEGTSDVPCLKEEEPEPESPAKSGREKLENQAFEMRHLAGRFMLADIATKSLQGPRHRELLNLLEMKDPESFAAPLEVRKLRGEGLLCQSNSSCRPHRAMGVKMLVSSVLLATVAAKLIITVEDNSDEDQLAKILLAVSMLLATVAGYLLRKWCAERRVEGSEDPSEVRSLRVSALRESEDDQWSVVSNVGGGTQAVTEHSGLREPLAHGHSGLREPLAHGHSGLREPLAPEHSGLREPLAPGHFGLREPLAPGHSGLREPLAPGHSGLREPLAPEEKKKDKWIIDRKRSVLIRLHSSSRLYLLDPRKLKLPDECQVSQLSGRRRSFVEYVDGSDPKSEILNDDFVSAGSKKLAKSWVGRTEFEIRKAASSRGAKGSGAAEAPARPRRPLIGERTEAPNQNRGRTAEPEKGKGKTGPSAGRPASESGSRTPRRGEKGAGKPTKGKPAKGAAQPAKGKAAQEKGAEQPAKGKPAPAGKSGKGKPATQEPEQGSGKKKNHRGGRSQAARANREARGAERREREGTDPVVLVEGPGTDIPEPRTPEEAPAGAGQKIPSPSSESSLDTAPVPKAPVFTESLFKHLG